jgi:hypothetical protein
MFQRMIFLTIIILFPFFFSRAADNPNQVDTNRQGFMLMLGEETYMLDNPDGRKLGVVEEDHMIWVSEIRGDFLHVQVEGWIKKTGKAFRQTPYPLILDKGADLFTKPGAADQIATLSESVTINVLEEKDGYARINVKAWISKSGSTDKNDNDPYTDIKDKTKKVIDTQVGIRQKNN